MKSFVLNEYGDFPLHSTEIPVPEINEYEVLAEIRSASVNPLDSKIRKGELKLILKYEMPLVLGNDFAGILTKVGAKVTRFKIGDEVYGRPRDSKIGTFAEFIAVHEDDIALKPKNLSFEEAASIPLVGLTSYQALHDVLGLRNEQKVLIHAGSGGVGTFAIQLAKLMGAYVATTVSEAGIDLVNTLGADEIVNYKEEQFEDILKDFDAVFDTQGGVTLETSFNVLKKGGKIVSVSGLPTARFAKEQGLGFVKTKLFAVASQKLNRLGKKHNVDYTFLFMKSNGQQLQLLTQYIESGEILPVLDRVFSFEETANAVEYSETGRAKGKIIVNIK
ncbi:NADP-dependent oxidoreductase [Sporosarcina sp. SAFN-010]|uniref:NADP-dependent oxidoreductase n=1 Tax=Sporosarcina sp. SAFN-010 TaxID=3387273 RepID=UPI003F7F2F85